MVYRATLKFEDLIVFTIKSCHGLNPKELFAGLVTFRCELLPEVIVNFISPPFYRYIFREHLDVEHLFCHEFISNEPNFNCNFWPEDDLRLECEM